MKVAFCTLGCKVNQYETEAMRELFIKAGYTPVDFDRFADIYVVNTCTVTQMSDKKSRQMLSRAHRLNPNAIIAAVGCYAESAKDSVKELDGVSVVIGTEGRENIVKLCESCMADHTKELYVSDGVREFEELSAVRESRTRASLKIQDGCASFCSYCAIPYARGGLRSRSFDDCGAELDTLVKSGYKEIVLVGIQLSAYGFGRGGDGHDLCDVIRLAQKLGVQRLRLGSLEPRFIDERFIETALACPCLCRQFHLSLQSGSDSVLARMNRRYDTEEYRKAVRLIRAVMPDAAITTDIIAGFVGETEDEHRQTLDFVREIGFARVHVFPYSKREGTAAAAMKEHLDKSVKERRARELIQLAEGLEKQYVASWVGKRVSVLVEERGEGYSGEYVRVKTHGDEGELVSGVIARTDGNLAYMDESCV